MHVQSIINCHQINTFMPRVASKQRSAKDNSTLDPGTLEHQVVDPDCDSPLYVGSAKPCMFSPSSSANDMPSPH